MVSDMAEFLFFRLLLLVDAADRWLLNRWLLLLDTKDPRETIAGEEGTRAFWPPPSVKAKTDTWLIELNSNAAKPKDNKFIFDMVVINPYCIFLLGMYCNNVGLGKNRILLTDWE
jgi:hypothetical protein